MLRRNSRVSQGYVYILTNPSFPEYVKIGYADDVKSRLIQLNRSECIPFAFRVYATYEVNSRLSDKKIHEIIDKLNPDLRAIESFEGKRRTREFYAMAKEDAYALLKSIAEINGLEKNLKLWGVDEKDKKAEELADEISRERNEKGEVFSFVKCNIPIGAELEYVRDNEIKCYVVDERRIRYNGEIMYTTTLAKMLSGKKHGVAGPTFFKYQGKNLQEYYDKYQAKK